MRKSRFSEEQIVAALQTGQFGWGRRRDLPEAGRDDDDLLPLEVEVLRTRPQRDEAPQAARGRKPAIEEDRRRPDPRHADPEGGARKKKVRPTARRQVVGHVRKKYELSERRICSLLGFWRGTMRYQSRRRMAPEL